jgi:single-strand DNA-binding protein
MNQVMLMGNLGKDPELRYTQSNKAVLTFSMGTSERWKDQQGNQNENTTWHTVVFWEKRAEALSKILAKGSKVLVRGKIKTRSWDDTQSGQKRYATDIQGEDLEFCGPAPQQNQQQQQASPNQQLNYQPQPVQNSGHQQSVQQQPRQQQDYPGTGIPYAQNNGNPPQAANHRNPNQANPPLGAQQQFAPNTNQHQDPATIPGLDEIPF